MGEYLHIKEASDWLLNCIKATQLIFKLCSFAQYVRDRACILVEIMSEYKKHILMLLAIHVSSANKCSVS